MNVQNIEIIISDSKNYKITKNIWLPRGTISIYTGDMIKYMNMNEIVKDNLDR